jgi:hypothetical protein
MQMVGSKVPAFGAGTGLQASLDIFRRISRRLLIVH